MPRERGIDGSQAQNHVKGKTSAEVNKTTEQSENKSGSSTSGRSSVVAKSQSYSEESISVNPEEVSASSSSSEIEKKSERALSNNEMTNSELFNKLSTQLSEMEAKIDDLRNSFDKSQIKID